jgi:predicted dehydrogenase
MVADYHRQAIAANAHLGAQLVAVGHYDPTQFENISDRVGVPCRTDEEILLDTAVHVICICTPSGQHASQAIATAQAGKHVLVEKPMALTLAAAQSMIDHCEQADVKLGVALQRRAEPLFQQVHQAIQAGDLGDLTLGAVTIPYHRPQTYYEQAAWRGTWSLDGGGVLMNQGIHLVDLLVWYMGDPVQVQAEAATLRRDIEVEDTLTALLQFANGAQATITATTTAAPGFPHRLEFYGTKGGIQIEGEAVVRWSLANPAQAKVPPQVSSETATAGAGGDPRGIAASGHIALVRDFIGALRDNRPPMVDGREGMRSLAAVLQIYQAAGRSVL